MEPEWEWESDVLIFHLGVSECDQQATEKEEGSFHFRRKTYNKALIILVKLWSHECTKGLPYQCCLLYLAIWFHIYRVGNKS